ncbi:MAG TPA: glycosyltransferase family 9 protein, partial [Candidatus Methylacidiphilales bacterium]
LAWAPGPLDEFLALVSRCDVVLGNDSASSHAGAAFGKRTATVFGSGSSRWFAPYSLDRDDALLFESSACPYRPCFDRCVQPSYVCLEGVSYEKVAAALAATIRSEGS